METVTPLDIAMDAPLGMEAASSPNALAEPKRKRHRRGKRKSERLILSSAESCIESCNLNTDRDDDDISVDGSSRKTAYKTYRRKRRGFPRLRPAVSPKAPQNYTQFLMADRQFYTPYDATDDVCGSVETDEAATNELEPSDYFMTNFNVDFNMARSEDLNAKSKPELINEIRALELKVHALQRDVSSLQALTVAEQWEGGENGHGSKLRQNLADLTHQLDKLAEENRQLKSA